jgi:hypothetical protein
MSRLSTGGQKVKQQALNLCIVAVIAVVVAAAAASISRSTPGPTLSNVGTPVAGIKAQGVTVREAHLLGTRAGHDLYRVGTDAGTCLAIADVGSTTADRVGCPFANFTRGPLRTLVTVASDGGGAFVASRVEGLAADGVESVEVHGANGTQVTTHVQGNLFSIPLALPLAGLKVVARDNTGTVVSSTSY